jgi:hypothetical protein
MLYMVLESRLSEPYSCVHLVVFGIVTLHLLLSFRVPYLCLGTLCLLQYWVVKSESSICLKPPLIHPKSPPSLSRNVAPACCSIADSSPECFLDAGLQVFVLGNRVWARCYPYTCVNTWGMLHILEISRVGFGKEFR